MLRSRRRRRLEARGAFTPIGQPSNLARKGAAGLDYRVKASRNIASCSCTGLGAGADWAVTASGPE